MKVLAYLHTFNDAEVIDATIRALCEQTYPIPEILLVDNASADGTLDRSFPEKVTVIRNDHNLGTSGAVVVGMQYAVAHGYDWIYILDADSTPAPDAIERLVRCYEGLSPELRTTTWWLSSLLKEEISGYMHYGCNFTDRGVEAVVPPATPAHYPCHTNMWSGSFYRLDAVKQVGLPDADYVLDWGDVIYGYEGMIRGYTGFIDRASIVLHHQHPLATMHFRRFGPRFVKMAYSQPIRFYYFWRNGSYFWLHRYKGGKYGNSLILAGHFFTYLKWLLKATLFIKDPRPILSACFRGMWDGIGAHLANRY